MVAYGKFFPTFCYRNPNFVIIFTPHRSVNHDRNYLIMFILGVDIRPSYGPGNVRKGSILRSF